MKKIIKKPWGSEEILSKNKKYVLKKLIMKKGCRCSLQYHRKKHETIYVLSGKLKILIGKNLKKLNKKILKKNQILILEPHTYHRMEGLIDSIYLEASTPQLSDVVRISDDYNRK
jgi:mannose-6-phosphate isomerase